MFLFYEGLMCAYVFLSDEGPTCFFLTKGLRVSFRRRAYVFLFYKGPMCAFVFFSDEGPTCFFLTKGLRVPF